ncbi:hypothetical protein ACPPVW_04910 [Leifsonia sp. McL0607]|uniref:hypothetical protein n=1 Tax=Leifsonia sp. McL0607 TaxID=3415672 RepID=UPI003CED164E
MEEIDGRVPHTVKANAFVCHIHLGCRRVRRVRIDAVADYERAGVGEVLVDLECGDRGRGARLRSGADADAGAPGEADSDRGIATASRPPLTP